jgi:hypothetical protein
MKNINQNKTVIDSAMEIIEMDRKLRYAESEIQRLKRIEQDYFKLLNGSIKHNDKMMGNLLVSILNK